MINFVGRLNSVGNMTILHSKFCFSCITMSVVANGKHYDTGMVSNTNYFW